MCAGLKRCVGLERWPASFSKALCGDEEALELGKERARQAILRRGDAKVHSDLPLRSSRTVPLLHAKTAIA